MDWQQFVMQLEHHDPDMIEAVLLQHGALAVTLSDGADNPVLEPAPGETPLWPSTQLSALFPADISLVPLFDELKTELGVAELPAHHVETLADRAWEREWLKDFRPMQFGSRLWVVPGDMTPPENRAVVIRLDPGLAFGTGTHPTTALCLGWLDSIDVEGAAVLDFGCGSGILAVAALKLGAAAAYGVDNDLQALTASRQNAIRNDVIAQLKLGQSLPPNSAGFDVVVANILAQTLVDHADAIVEQLKPGGRLALSGILAEQAAAVADAFLPRIRLESKALDNWVLLTGEKN